MSLVCELRLYNQNGLIWSGHIDDTFDKKEMSDNEKAIGRDFEDQIITSVDVMMENQEEYITGSLRAIESEGDEYPYRVRLWLLVEDNPKAI